MRLSLLLTYKSLGLGGQGYDGEIDSTEQWPMERMNICSNWRWLVSGRNGGDGIKGVLVLRFLIDFMKRFSFFGHVWVFFMKQLFCYYEVFSW